MSNLHAHDMGQLVRDWINQQTNPYGTTPTQADPRDWGYGRTEGTMADPRAEARGGAAVDAEMDRVMTDQWSDRMRAGREGRKAVADEFAPRPAESESEALQPPSEYGPGRPGGPDKPSPKGPKGGWDESGLSPSETASIVGKGAVENELWPELTGGDPRARPAGEQAVAQGLRDINMKPLIDQALQYQQLSAIRDAIMQQMQQDYPNIPESQIPFNRNQIPGSNTSMMSIIENLPGAMTPEGYPVPPGSPLAGGSGSGHVLDPFGTRVTAPPPANPNTPGFREGAVFPPALTHPDQPDFRVGLHDPEDPDKRPPE